MRDPQAVGLQRPRAAQLLVAPVSPRAFGLWMWLQSLLSSRGLLSCVSVCLCLCVLPFLVYRNQRLPFRPTLIQRDCVLNCILIISAESLFQVRALSEVPSRHEFWAGGHFNSILVLLHLIRKSLKARSIYYGTPIKILAQNMMPENKNSSVDESVCLLSSNSQSSQHNRANTLLIYLKSYKQKQIPRTSKCLSV